MPGTDSKQEPCPECGGRGWVVQPDGGAGTARRCPCQEEGLTARLVAAARIPAIYQHCRLATFHTSSHKARRDPQLFQAKTIAQQYVDEFLVAAEEGGGFRRTGLLFVGPPGVGKTHLAAAVLVDSIERYRVRGRFVEFTSLIHQLQSSFDPGSQESKREILDPLTDAELLVIDELGAQQPTPWVRDVLYLLINARYTRRRPTLFTTNYRLEPLAPGAARGASTLDRGRDPEPGPEEAPLLASRLPAMLISRLHEMARPVLLTGVEDFRREHKVLGAHLHRARA
jgi:DNA replication protein DnaC